MDYYEPREIVFSRDNNFWLIKYLDELKAGTWPDFPSSGYTDAAAQTSLSAHAVFETPEMCAAEVERRLDLTGRDGKILVWQINAGIDYYEGLEPEAKVAMNYISIIDFRKRKSYPEWRRSRIGFYRKETKSIKKT